MKILSEATFSNPFHQHWTGAAFKNIIFASQCLAAKPSLRKSIKSGQVRQANKECQHTPPIAACISFSLHHQGLQGHPMDLTTCKDQPKASWYSFKILGKWLKKNAREFKIPKATLSLPLFLSPASYGAAKWEIGASKICNWLGYPWNVKILENKCDIWNQQGKKQQDWWMEKN